MVDTNTALPSEHLQCYARENTQHNHKSQCKITMVFKCHGRKVGIWPPLSTQGKSPDKIRNDMNLGHYKYEPKVGELEKNITRKQHLQDPTVGRH